MILNVILPLLPSFWDFSLALECEVSFFSGIQHSPVDGYSAANCNFGVLAEDECMSFYSAILPLPCNVAHYIHIYIYTHTHTYRDTYRDRREGKEREGGGGRRRRRGRRKRRGREREKEDLSSSLLANSII